MLYYTWYIFIYILCTCVIGWNCPECANQSLFFVKTVSLTTESLKIVLNDHQSTLDEMLDTLNEKTIHQQCIDRLLTEVYKFLNVCSPDFMIEVFHLRQNADNLRNVHAFAIDVPRNNCVLNSVVYRTNQFWETLPFDLKNSCLLELFKKGLKNWRCTRFPCQIWSRFIADVEYI